MQSARTSPDRTAPTPANLLMVGIACFASNISARATDPILPQIAGQFYLTLQHAAWISTTYGVLFAVSQPILGPVADAIGKSIVIKVCLVLLAASFAACALAPGFDGLLAARGFSGIVAGGIFPVAIALVAERVPYERRQLALSRLVIAAITGQMAGAAAAGGIATIGGWRSVFAATALFTAGVALMAFLRLSGEGDMRRRLSLTSVVKEYSSLIRNRQAALVYGTVLLEGLFMFGVFPFVGPTLSSRGEGGTLAAGICIASYAMGAVIYGIAAKTMIDRLGPWRMITTGGLIVGLCYGIIAAPVPMPAMAALFAVAGFGFYLFHNTLQTLSTELAPEARGSAVALLACAFYAGQGLGPILAGHVSAIAGYPTMFATSAVLMAGLGLSASALLPPPNRLSEKPV